MFRRCVRIFENWIATTPIVGVLKGCRPCDTEGDFNLNAAMLGRLKIYTAEDWCKFSDTNKKKIIKAGLPKAVVNSLNASLLPSGT